jgi:hypothetical protein
MKHSPKSEETVQGHTRKMPSGLQSTKKLHSNDTVHNKEENTKEHPTLKHHDIFTQVNHIKDEEFLHIIFLDQTGHFPKKSSKGNQYIIILVHINSAAILVVAMKDHTSEEMIRVRVYQSLIDRLKEHGIHPKHHVLDNKCSTDFKAAIKLNHMTYQLVSPHDYRHNIAKKGVQTFKAHFISILCGADKDFPLHLWCQLLPQAKHTLSAMTSMHVSHSFGICLLMGPPRLQCPPICSPWLQGQGLSSPRHPRDLGTSHSQWILHWECPRALQMSQGVHPINKEHSSLQHSVFQTQILNSVDNHPQHSLNSCHQQTCRCHLRSSPKDKCK